MKRPEFSIIIPTYNEATCIERCLFALQPFKPRCELIVADGGSLDNTIALAKPLADRLIDAGKGRARQMNAGASLAQADMLLFLHADTFLPDDALDLINNGLHKNYLWGRFDIDLTGTSPMLKIIAAMMNFRSRLTGIATGDQVIFVSRRTFEQIGCFPVIPLMEDIAICKKLKQLDNPYCIKAKVTSSGRRWEEFGLARTILLMWALRLGYFFGLHPELLAKYYTQEYLWKQ
jgi:rSAM/selenodomain-associated transferase 2